MMCDEKRGYHVAFYPATLLKYSAHLVDLVPSKQKTWWQRWKARRSSNANNKVKINSK